MGAKAGLQPQNHTGGVESRQPQPVKGLQVGVDLCLCCLCRSGCAVLEAAEGAAGGTEEAAEQDGEHLQEGLGLWWETRWVGAQCCFSPGPTLVTTTRA